MHPDVLQVMVRDHEQQVSRQLRLAYLRHTAPAPLVPTNEAVVLRLCCVHDDAELDALAELEGRPVSAGRHVVAEIGGIVVAALPLDGGPVLADPFRSTAHVLPLLELRAKQIQPTQRSRSNAVWGVVRHWSRA